MCGQCGALSSFLTDGEKSLFAWTLRFNYFRGKDSTGVAAVTKPDVSYNKGKKPKVRPSKVLAWKEARPVHDFLYFTDLDTKDVKKSIFQGEQKRLLMGHCRAATIGKVTASNAHPFHRGNILGMHNGTIRKSFDGSKDFETDSEAFFDLINKVGIKDAIQEVEATDTAYAIQYFNRVDNTFNIIKNDRRPLSLIYTKARGSLFWSSEEEDLRYAARKLNVDLEATVIVPKPYVLYTFNLLSEQPHKEFQTTDLTPKKTTWHTPGATSSGGVGKSSYSTGTRTADSLWMDERYTYYYSDPNERYDRHTYVYEYRTEEGTWTTDLNKKAKKKFVSSVPALRSTTDVPIGREELEEWEASESIAELHARKLKETRKSPGSVFYGFNGRALTRRDFEERMLQGCTNCSHQPLPEEEDIEYRIGWHDDKTFFCDECMKDLEIVKYLVKHQNKKSDGPPWEEDGQEGVPEGDI